MQPNMYPLRTQVAALLGSKSVYAHGDAAFLLSNLLVGSDGTGAYSYRTCMDTGIKGQRGINERRKEQRVCGDEGHLVQRMPRHEVTRTNGSRDTTIIRHRDAGLQGCLQIQGM